ncbi:Ras- protein Rab-31 [Tritrichomonas musculus]|uniref:Ras- protein Rab-31 n=1 Tax=Tritrichomonas musculus TaxID=1915356 RepID=A0ABR2GSI5_9EUKA
MIAEEQIKIVLVGNSGVGKTSILNWYQRNVQDTSPTIGANCTDILVEINGKKTNLNIWDTAGQLQFRDLMPLYFRDACVILICFSAENQESLDAVTDWDDLIVNRAPENVVKIVVCNKIDLEQEPIPQNKLVSLQLEIGAAEVFRTSAVTGEGIDLIFDYIKNEGTIPRDRSYLPHLNDQGDVIVPNGEGNNQKKCC